MMRTTPLLLALLAACGCASKTTPVPSATVVPGGAGDAQHILRTYEVPPGREAELKRLLEGLSYPISVVSKDGLGQTQFVRINPQFTTGHFALSAPAGIHDGVSGLLETLKRSPAPPAPRTVELTYWLVLGWPAAGADVGAIPELAEPLAALGKVAPLKFELLEKLRVEALDGREAKVSGRYAKISQTTTMEGGKVGLDLDLSVQDAPAFAGLESNLTLTPGRFVVLGEAGFLPEAAKARAKDGQIPSLFYVARATPID